MGKHVNIICANNGVGLSQDREILKAILTANGHQVSLNEGMHPKDMRKRYDLNIFCEQLHPQWIGLAKKNIMIPNPEWFFEGWIKYLYRFDKIFCKTKDCERIFIDYADMEQLVYTSFTSQDRYLKGIKKQRVFSHFAGKSNHKGTGAIVAASKCRKLPLLNLYLTPNEGQQKYYVNNTDVILHTQRIPDDKFRQLQNSSMFHLCPSEYEGWGHYINEAKSIGAIIITTNAAPMNELVTSSFGFGAAYDTVTKHHLAPTYKANPESIAECILLAAEMSDSVAKKLSRKSREDYLNNDKQFKEVFINQVNLLLN